MSDLGKSGSALASDIRPFKQIRFALCKIKVVMFRLFEVNIELRIASSYHFNFAQPQL